MHPPGHVLQLQDFAGRTYTVSLQTEAMPDRRHVPFSPLVFREFGHGCFLGSASASFTILGGPPEK